VKLEKKTMFDESKKVSLSNRCAPVTAPGQSQQQTKQPRVWSLTQMGEGMAGEQALTLSGILERLLDESGNFRGQIVHPVVGEIQQDPGVARLQRAFEFRAARTADGQTGVVYRMLPSSTTGANSWLASAESAMHSLVGAWGRVTSDRNAEVYRFERLNIEPYEVGAFPDIDDLIDEVLAYFVIESLDHPVLQRLLGAKPAAGKPTPYPATGSSFNLGADDEIY
jgi:hypothetical protein